MIMGLKTTTTDRHFFNEENNLKNLRDSELHSQNTAHFSVNPLGCYSFCKITFYASPLSWFKHKTEFFIEVYHCNEFLDSKNSLSTDGEDELSFTFNNTELFSSNSTISDDR